MQSYAVISLLWTADVMIQMENYIKREDSIQTSYYEAQRQQYELRHGSNNQPEDYL